MPGFLSFLAYVWRVLINLVMLTIVAGTLLSARGRFEITVIAILGMIYVAVRSSGIGYAMTYIQLTHALDNEFTRVRELLGEDQQGHRQYLSDLQRTSSGRLRRLYIDAVFHSIAFLICLYWLVTASETQF